MGSNRKKVILSGKGVQDCIHKLAEQIIEAHSSLDDVVLIGIRTGGEYLARRLAKVLNQKTKTDPLLGFLDITLYRDDWTRIGPAPEVRKTEIPFSIDNKTIILVDDVLFTGRTVRAAMDALIDLGRPKRIELAILADRGQKERELPISPNYVGGVWEVPQDKTINVYLKEAGFEDQVVLEDRVRN